MENHLLTLIVFAPLVMAGVLLLVPAKHIGFFKWGALLGSVGSLLAALFVFHLYDNRTGVTGIDNLSTYQFVEKMDWISLDLGQLGQLSIQYFLGIDGVSMPLILLASIVMVIGVLASWSVEEKTKSYFLLYLLLSTSIFGCFLALDFFLFFLFFEFMLLPMYFLIGLWGGVRREYAAIKFFLYTFFGSVFILIVMIGLYSSVIDPIKMSETLQVSVSQVQQMLQQGSIASDQMIRTFDMTAMMQADNFIPGSVLSLFNGLTIGGYSARLIAFLFLLLGFLIKLPAVPFHTWLPDAHVEAPTAISVVLAAVLLKIGGYGLIRIVYPIFPEGAIQFAVLVGFLGVLAIIYGALNALAMKDLKKMIAFSSISHMGFVLLGLASLTAEGVSGALYQMVSHGFISAALFLIVGVIYDRTYSRQIADFAGLATLMPKFTAVVVISFFASLGLPGFSGFIAELLTLLGAFHSHSLNDLLPLWMPIVAVLGLLLTAAYYLWTIQRMFFGKAWLRNESWMARLTDLSSREWLMFVPLMLLMIALGVFPHLLLDISKESISYFTELVNGKGFEQLQLLYQMTK